MRRGSRPTYRPPYVAFSAFVLTLVADARGFLLKLDALARRRVSLYLGAYSADALLDPLWRHFHGAPRAPGPTYLDAIAVVLELAVAPEVKVVDIPAGEEQRNRIRRYAGVAGAPAGARRASRRSGTSR